MFFKLQKKIDTLNCPAFKFINSFVFSKSTTYAWLVVVYCYLNYLRHMNCFLIDQIYALVAPMQIPIFANRDDQTFQQYISLVPCQTRMYPGAKTDLRPLTLNLSVYMCLKLLLASNKKLLTRYVSLDPVSYNTASGRGSSNGFTPPLINWIRKGVRSKRRPY